MSRFFCLSIPDFPAWAAARSDTALRGQTLVVYAGGKVIAASPQAIEAAACSSAGAGLRSLPLHAPTVTAAWHEVLAALYDLTPQIESMRPGHR